MNLRLAEVLKEWEYCFWVLLYTSDICYSGSVSLYDKFTVLMMVISGKKFMSHTSHCVRCSGVYQPQAGLAIRFCQGFLWDGGTCLSILSR